MSGDLEWMRQNAALRNDRDDRVALLSAARARIAELEAALRPFADAGRKSLKSDAHHKIIRAPDESVGCLVDAQHWNRAVAMIDFPKR